MIHLGSLKMPVTTYASQGNAILGIRGSGKTYTATWLAEQLLAAQIPFVAFDPIGVWRFLKVPGKGHGFKVVVAGGEHGDLPLTPETAPEIVRAAMRENIPLVLDLYSMNLSKADWIAIVEKAIRLLLYENKACGLRHVFIEEAAEFAPQRVQLNQGRVYAEIEKLARMGGNASLGYTLINQRSEEVNKAVLELCDCLFLHRQKGRNSLTALEKWLQYADESRSKEIAQSLPMLGPGECWVWTEGSNAPERVKVPTKKSFHPDRKNPETAQAAKSPQDVGAFVEQLKGALTEASLEKVNQEDPAHLRSVIAGLEKQLAEAQRELSIPRPTTHPELMAALARTEHAGAKFVQAFQKYERCIQELQTKAKAQEESSVQLVGPPKNVRGSIVFSGRNVAGITGKILPREDNGSLPGGVRRMLIALAQRPEGLHKPQLGVRAGLASSSGTFGTYLGKLRSLGYVVNDGARLVITGEGLMALGEFKPLPKGRELLHYWLNQLPRGAQAMLNALVNRWPDTMSAEELGAIAQVSHTSGTFGTYLGKLRTLELVQGDRNNLRASSELIES